MTPEEIVEKLIGIRNSNSKEIIPIDVIALTPLSEITIKVCQILNHEIVLSFVEDIAINGKFLQLKSCIVSLLHTIANLNRAGGNHDVARIFFEKILLLTPEDHNVRIALFEYLRQENEYKAATGILAPVIDVLRQNLDVYGNTLKQYVANSFKASEYSEAIKTISNIAFTKSDEEIKRIKKRIEEISNTFPEFLKYTLEGDDYYWNNCFQSMSEYELISAIEIVAEKIDLIRKGKKTTKVLLVLLKTSLDNKWKIIARNIIEYLINGNSEVEYSDIVLIMEEIGYSTLQSEAIANFMCKVGQANNDEENSNFIKDIVCNWQENSNNGKLQLVSDLTAASKNKLSKISPFLNNLAIIDQFHKGEILSVNDVPDIWYFITWQNNNEQLARQLHGLIKSGNRYVVSIGGNSLPIDVSDTTSLLNLDGLYFIHCPVVAWGGQKLLYQNLFIAAEAFDKVAKDDSWFQCICNRSYPIISAIEAGKKLGQPDFFKGCNLHDPPYAWHIEWPDEVVANLPEIFTASINNIFKNCDTSSLKKLAYDDTRYASPVFNFSDSSKVLEEKFKDSSHNYCVSPFETDIRWMSFARMLEFVDTSTENGQTYSRRLNPRVLKWAHKVMYKHNMRTGDPFITFNKKYAGVIVNDENAIELFSAMNLGFGPEMNFFDTVQMSPQYDVKYDMGHLFYRNLELSASDKYIAEAEQASISDNRMFVRKTVPDGIEFIKYFANKNAASISDGYNYFSFYNEIDAPHKSAMLELGDLWPKLYHYAFTIRDLNGVVRTSAKFLENGIIVSVEGKRIGVWSFDNAMLNIFFEIDGLGEKDYKNFTVTKDSIILVPDELVSLRNGWSAFLEWSTNDLFVNSEEEVLFHSGPFWGGNVQWHAATNIDVSMLSCFEKNDCVDYPSAVEKYPGVVKDVKLIDKKIIALCECDDVFALFELKRITKSLDRIVRTYVPAEVVFYEKWDKELEKPYNTTIKATDLYGHVSLEVLEGKSDIIFVQGGIINDIYNNMIGRWFIYNGLLFVFGLPEIAYGKISQILYEDGCLMLSGWGRKNLKDLVTFRLKVSIK